VQGVMYRRVDIRAVRKRAEAHRREFQRALTAAIVRVFGRDVRSR
jgi:hypothetical protein